MHFENCKHPLTEEPRTFLYTLIDHYKMTKGLFLNHALFFAPSHRNGLIYVKKLMCLNFFTADFVALSKPV